MENFSYHIAGVLSHTQTQRLSHSSARVSSLFPLPTTIAIETIGSDIARERARARVQATYQVHWLEYTIIGRDRDQQRNERADPVFENSV